LEISKLTISSAWLAMSRSALSPPCWSASGNWLAAVTAPRRPIVEEFSSRVWVERTTWPSGS
jgi:hypothetical protein